MSPSILIIDDSEDIHRLIRSALAEEACRIHSAYGGSEGLDIAAGGEFNLILLDLDLPDMNGFEVCRHLKSNPKTSGASVIFLTTLAGPDERACAAELGAAEYMTKPINVADLFGHAGRVLRMKSPLDTMSEAKGHHRVTKVSGR